MPVLNSNYKSYMDYFKYYSSGLSKPILAIIKTDNDFLKVLHLGQTIVSHYFPRQVEYLIFSFSYL